MLYLCLGYQENEKLQAMSDEDRASLMEECRAYDRMLWENGFCLKGNALPSAQAAVTLRFENGKVCVEPGPFADKKEQLGGILLLEARDLNHAIQLMSKLPAMRRGGALEIRPLAPAQRADGEGS